MDRKLKVAAYGRVSTVNSNRTVLITKAIIGTKNLLKTLDTNM